MRASDLHKHSRDLLNRVDVQLTLSRRFLIIGRDGINCCSILDDYEKNDREVYKPGDLREVGTWLLVCPSTKVGARPPAGRETDGFLAGSRRSRDQDVPANIADLCDARLFHVICFGGIEHAPRSQVSVL